MGYRIFVINTGSTSTKVALYVDSEEVYKGEVTHDTDELNACGTIDEQIAYRKQCIDAMLGRDHIDLTDIDAIACRGGTFGRVEGGAYLVDEKLLEACRHPASAHASNLSALVGHIYAKEMHIPAYIYDAVCTDEIENIAKYTGLKGVYRRPFSHVLNTRAVARAYADSVGKAYEDVNLIVAHLGGGMSINVHSGGKIIDLVTDDDGAMSPERCGRINALTMTKLCYSGQWTRDEMNRLIKGESGLQGYLGVKDLRVIEKMIERGDTEAAFIVEVMAYQIAKDIGSLAAVLEGKVDGILLTGGCAYSRRLVDPIIRRVSFIAPVKLYPGAMEMEALARGAERVLEGKEPAKKYQGDIPVVK